jgi:hypothetical protein
MLTPSLRFAFCATVLSLLATSQIIARTLWSRSDNTTWSLTEDGANCGCTPVQNDDIFVKYNITITGNFTVNTGSLTVLSGVTLTIDGDLTFNNGSTVQIDGTLHVKGNFENKNQSNDVAINGSLAIDGSFKNGSGSGTGAIITLGPGATISYQPGQCSNPGSIVDSNGVPLASNGCTGPLPVKLIFFKAEQRSTEVLLTWATASELNFEYFAIERADDQLVWEEIGRVNGNGTTKDRIDYSFIDLQPGIIGNIYYRLKAVDFDGHTEYFNVASLNLRTAKSWYVSPNPAVDGQIVLMRNFSDDESIIISLYSINGAQILSERVNMMTNRYELKNHVSPGMYILKLKENNQTRHIRVVVE